MFFKKNKKINDIDKVDEYVPKKVVNSKKKFTSFEVVFISLIILFFGFISGCLVTMYTKEVLGSVMDDNIREFLSTYEYVKDNYYEDVDESQLMKSAIAGMLNSLGDDFSYYMDKDSTDSFNTTIDGEYEGIGITIQTGDEGTSVVGIFEGSPAEKSGLKIGDIIIKVNGEDVSDKNSNDIAKMVTGALGKKSLLTIKRDEQELEFEIEVANIEIPSVYTDIKENNEKKIGYIHVDNFAANTYSQFKRKLEQLEKDNIDSLIIDVRDNTGGHLSQVTEMLDMFFKKKTVLYQIDTKGKVKKYTAKTNEERQYPIAILTNGQSASASEVLTACFKENYKDVTIVGTKTYGKGTVQQALDLSNGSSFKFTTQKWLTPNGNWVHEVGIEPDVVIEFDKESETDNQLEEAIRILGEK